MGYDVSFITSRWIYNKDGHITRFEKSHYWNGDGVFMIRLPNRLGETYEQKFKHFDGLTSELEKEQPDIMFIHGPQFLEMKEIVKYVRNKNIRIYVDNHADFSNSGRKFLSKYILQGIVWKHMAHIIEPYTSKFYGVLPARVEWLKNVYKLPPSKCELLVMGADDDMVEEASCPDIRTNLRYTLGIGDDDFLIVTGGKIDPWKKQTLMLMDAVAKIDDPKIKLLLFGSVTDDLKEEFEKRCTEGKIIYVGWLETDVTYSYVAASDLVVFPGRHSVFWEQVCGQGKPMIVKHWEGTTHVDLGGNVEFLYKDSVDEIYEKIMEIVDNPTKYEMMKSVAESKGMEMFSYKKIAERAVEGELKK